jgi:glutaconate CoA-transferase subunit B
MGSNNSAEGSEMKACRVAEETGSVNPVYTRGELLLAAASREIRDREMVFVGMRLPMLASLVAKRTHAPGAIVLFENGEIRESPIDELLYTMGDTSNLRGTAMCGQMMGAMGLLQQGRVDAGLLGAAEIGCFGNLNGMWRSGKDGAVRLPGSGGAVWC